MWFTQDGLRPHINCQSFIIIPSEKMIGYNLQQPRCTSSSLSHTITKIVLQCCNKIHNRITIISFYRRITMEKYHSHPIPWVHKILAKRHPKNFFWGLFPRILAKVLLAQDPPRGTISPHTSCSDECTMKMGYKQKWTITFVNLEDQPPQLLISHLDIDHNNYTSAALVGL